MNISELTRSEIRYALFRCKSGNPSDVHLDIFNVYKPLLEDHEFGIENFNDKWDISKEDVNKVVFGKTVKEYIAINETKESNPSKIQKRGRK